MNHSILGILPLATFFSFAPFISFSQINTTAALDATELAVGIFQGSGVTITNATLNGSGTMGLDAAGSYTADAVPIVPASGVVLGTGYLTGIGNPSSVYHGDIVNANSTDADLASITGGNIFDAVVLEFDFVPDQDVMLFDYVFASEEYPEFVCAFNDGFGFFLSGPGIVGPFSNSALNIALLPGTSVPVTINTVNNGLNNDPNNVSCPAVNAEFYLDNSLGQTLVFDGSTVILQATALVVPGETYHIKLAIGDALDQSYDSGLFLMANSFRSESSIALGASSITSGTKATATFGSDGRLMLRGDGLVSGAELFDLHGQRVLNAGAGSLPMGLDTGALPGGLYILRAMINGEFVRIKVTRD